MALWWENSYNPFVWEACLDSFDWAYEITIGGDQEGCVELIIESIT